MLQSRRKKLYKMEVQIMDWTTILLIKLGGGLAAIALAYGICVTTGKTIALSKKALP